jgi:ATP-dependent Clp protease ATP-binding subunit ClpA
MMVALGLREDLELELRASIPPAGEKISTSADMPLSHTAKRVLAYGAEEAERWHHAKIAPEHLLLALLREETPAKRILQKHGVALDPLRQKIETDGIRMEAGEQDTDLRSRNRAIVHTLRETFGPMASRLTSEIEPAVTFSLKPGGAA